MFKINIYTDGSCINNPGPGGCASIIKFCKRKFIFKAGYYYTTNNRMELMAFILPLRFLLFKKKKQKLYIFTDSIYLYKGINNWLFKWSNNNWKNSTNKIIKNIDLWIEIYKIIYFLNKKIKIIYIKSHNKNFYNEQCDYMAFIEANRPFLKDLPLPHKR